MQVITFGKLEAQEGQGNKLMEVIQEHMKALMNQPGLIHGYIAKSKGNEDKFVVISIWENEEAQQTAMTKLTSDPSAAAGFLQLMQMLNGQPEFGNYTVESITK
ncbi:Antibiotic biosynthesis monooxygenase [Desulforamulus reducens MI-1]|uniref:Antibiotic biosynthesis monooxygenase n=1 Tax=Desulforamulus reducens (strain ATCC BAA-1160 / DSM 100696 / MI-1) TaxID=349161 RepID=A4J6X9_DESRM|nr:antibiotic biosynthesis monooxygenase family protein [Desulforamulus reducens]ABO50832.1 Antibiotic biosynthesis monooxygenase [Desulforamulus reducens MI-1]